MGTLQTNKDNLVMQSVEGQVSPPRASVRYRVDTQGQAHTLPATGGICYNVRVGDSAMRWVCDHVEPGVTIKARDAAVNDGLNLLACVGNRAVVVSGDAKGERGFVTGKHGGVEHVLIDFAPEVLDRLSHEDRILVRSFGQGLMIEGMDEVHMMNLDPDLFEKMGCTVQDGILRVPVTHKIPAYLMGSGIGSDTSAHGDYDIMTADKGEVRRLGLDRLRFGDIVLLEDCDTTYGRGYLKGACTIGIVVHSDCIKMGHGPGVTTLMTCKTGKIQGELRENANLAVYMGIR